MARARDAGNIAQLVEEEFGARYADLWMRDPTLVAAALETRHVLFAVAEDEAGRHVAQMAMERRGQRLYEHGRGIVTAPFRGQRLLERLGELLFAELADTDARFVYGRSVTEHVITQRYTRGLGFVPLGLLLGPWPASRPDGKPVSALFTGRFLGPAPRPRQLALTGVDRTRAASILDQLGAPVRAQTARIARTLGARIERNAAHGLVHVRLGRGLAPMGSLGDLVAREDEAEPRVMWVDVPADHPRADELAGQARDLGFWFGAYVPLAEVQGGDVLRLQRYVGPPLVREEVLVVDEARALRDAVLAEASAVIGAVNA
jgi:hypothetical protein